LASNNNISTAKVLAKNPVLRPFIYLSAGDAAQDNALYFLATEAGVGTARAVVAITIPVATIGRAGMQIEGARVFFFALLIIFFCKVGGFVKVLKPVLALLGTFLDQALRVGREKFFLRVLPLRRAVSFLLQEGNTSSPMFSVAFNFFDEIHRREEILSSRHFEPSFD